MNLPLPPGNIIVLTVGTVVPTTVRTTFAPFHRDAATSWTVFIDDRPITHAVAAYHLDDATGMLTVQAASPVAIWIIPTDTSFLDAAVSGGGTWSPTLYLLTHATDRIIAVSSIPTAPSGYTDLGGVGSKTAGPGFVTAGWGPPVGPWAGLLLAYS